VSIVPTVVTPEPPPLQVETWEEPFRHNDVLPLDPRVSMNNLLVSTEPVLVLTVKKLLVPVAFWTWKPTEESVPFLKMDWPEGPIVSAVLVIPVVYESEVPNNRLDPNVPSSNI
jgi:hypothetical protein